MASAHQIKSNIIEQKIIYNKEEDLNFSVRPNNWLRQLGLFWRHEILE